MSLKLISRALKRRWFAFNGLFKGLSSHDDPASTQAERLQDKSRQKQLKLQACDFVNEQVFCSGADPEDTQWRQPMRLTALLRSFPSFINARAWSSMLGDDQYKLSQAQTAAQLPFQLRLQSFGFS